MLVEPSVFCDPYFFSSPGACADRDVASSPLPFRRRRSSPWWCGCPGPSPSGAHDRDARRGRGAPRPTHRLEWLVRRCRAGGASSLIVQPRQPLAVTVRPARRCATALHEVAARYRTGSCGPLPLRQPGLPHGCARRCRNGRYCPSWRYRSPARSGLGFSLEQGGRLHDLAALAVSALRHIRRTPRHLHRMIPVLVEPLDGRRPACRRAAASGWTQERMAFPRDGRYRRHTPPMPHPNLVPVRPSSSRRYQRRGMAASPSKVRASPLMVICIRELRSCRLVTFPSIQ